MKNLPIYPVPFGEGSVHWSLYFYNLEIPMRWTQASIWHYLYYRSNYDTGKTHILSADEIVQETGFSRRFFFQTCKHFEKVGFLENRYKRKGGSIYQLNKYVDTTHTPAGTLDLRYWAPRREYKGIVISDSPISQWVDGKIKASDYILWMAMNRHSDWRKGITQGEVTLTNEWMINLTGLSKYLVNTGLQRLKDANLIYKISKETQQSTHVVYPFIQEWIKRQDEIKRNEALLANADVSHDEIWHEIIHGDSVEAHDPSLEKDAK